MARCPGNGALRWPILLRDDHGGHLESASTCSAGRSKGGAPGPNGAASAVTMGLLLRGNGNLAADVLTTEHDTSLAEDDVTFKSLGLDDDTRVTSQWCHRFSALRQRPGLGSTRASSS